MRALEFITESEAWQTSKGKNPNGGLNKKGVSSYRASHPGSHLQTAVTTKPSKLKKGSKASKRRKSFCARMKGMKKHRTGAKTKHDPNSRINKSLRKWHCESIEEMRDLIMLGESYIAEIKKGQKDSNGFTKCWPGHHAAGTKKGKNGGQVRNCVPNESQGDAWVTGGPLTEGKHCDAKNAVSELKAALTKRKTELKNADTKVAYNKIDKIMTRIAQTYNISGQELHDLWTERYGEIPDTWVLDENFADGKHPEDKGDSKRYHVPTKASVSTLRNVAKQGGRKGQLAHWMANMKAGKKKHAGK